MKKKKKVPYRVHYTGPIIGEEYNKVLLCFFLDPSPGPPSAFGSLPHCVSWDATLWGTLKDPGSAAPESG